jgi:ADP-dependent NAD(P)H-hydrate dehydratase / NAD(P)H-hydrate epimerase
MNIYNAQQIKQWDHFTIQNEPIAAIDLMERAANAVVNELLHLKYQDKLFYIFCGNGNNGGDGLAIARLLHMKQRQVKLFVLEADNYASDYNTNLQRAKSLNLSIKEIDGAEEFPIIPTDVIVLDALFGYGLNRPLDGLVALLAQHINQHSSIISIDIPSGLFTDKSSLGGAIIKATTTLCFQVPKLAFLMAENAVYTGEWKVLDIGLHQQYNQQTASEYELLELPFIKSIIKPRPKFSHKYHYGHALLYAGSPGMYGAGILCAKACLKSGVGLVSIVVEEKYLSIYQTTLPEAICITDWNNENVCIKKNAIGIGPGWANSEAYIHTSKKVLTHNSLPLIIDASALELLADENILKGLQPGTIITPHLGEFEKCFGKSNNDFDRLQLALQKAKELNIYIVLKGPYTIIATPEGKVYFNSTGNAGMAKGGSGDVLTGLLTGLLAQGYSPLHTCLLGVYLHGIAGDIAAEATTQYAMTAMDIIDNIGEAWKLLL